MAVIQVHMHTQTQANTDKHKHRQRQTLTLHTPKLSLIYCKGVLIQCKVHRCDKRSILYVRAIMVTDGVLRDNFSIGYKSISENWFESLSRMLS